MALATVFFFTGCATHYSDMVRFTPAEEFDSRSAVELFDDLNRVMPFSIDSGDFVVNEACDGPSCWVSFQDGKRTRMLLEVLESSPEWKLSTIGFVRKEHRALFGLNAQPGEYDQANFRRMFVKYKADTQGP
jgi:hypothetical protein